jgi:hypothetical protein
MYCRSPALQGRSRTAAEAGVRKAVENLPELRQRLESITDNYLNVQQDILEKA